MIAETQLLALILQVSLIQLFVLKQHNNQFYQIQYTLQRNMAEHACILHEGVVEFGVRRYFHWDTDDFEQRYGEDMPKNPPRVNCINMVLLT